MRGRRSAYRLAGNLLFSRGSLLRATGCVSDEDLYSKLLASPPSQASAFKLVDFSNYYEQKRLPLGLLGFARYYEKDGGWYLNSGIVVTRVGGESFNASVHRFMLIDDRRFAIRLVPRHLHYAYIRARERGEDLPVTILLGNHPLLMLLAANSPPLGVYEFSFLPLFTKGPVEGARSPLYGNVIPLGSSVVIEARITREEVPEGPYADILLTYDAVRKQPIVEVDEVWVIKVGEPILHVLLQGGVEHRLLMGTPREAAVWDSVRRVVPSVKKARLTMASGNWLHAVISITKSHDGDGKNAIMAALAAHPGLKLVVVVDDDVDPDNQEEVEWALATRFQADRGLVVVHNARGSTLDPSSRDGLTSKIGLDATAPLGERERFAKARIPGV